MTTVLAAAAPGVGREQRNCELDIHEKVIQIARAIESAGEISASIEEKKVLVSADNALGCGIAAPAPRYFGVLLKRHIFGGHRRNIAGNRCLSRLNGPLKLQTCSEELFVDLSYSWSISNV